MAELPPDFGNIEAEDGLDNSDDFPVDVAVIYDRAPGSASRAPDPSWAVAVSAIVIWSFGHLVGGNQYSELVSMR